MVYEMHQIFVKGPVGGCQVLAVTENTMPIDCFLLIDSRVCGGKLMQNYEKGKIKFRLMCNGKYLNNVEGLLDQGVVNDSTLQLNILPLR